jgi:hypothetical protein
MITKIRGAMLILLLIAISFLARIKVVKNIIGIKRLSMRKSGDIHPNRADINPLIIVRIKIIIPESHAHFSFLEIPAA